MLYLKISGLKIAVHSLKISGLKIITRVCVCAYVCACAPHFAEVSKMAQDAPGATTRAGAKEHKHQSDHHTKNTSDHHKSSTTTGAGAQPQERERDQSERTSRHAHPIRKRKLKNNSKLIFF